MGFDSPNAPVHRQFQQDDRQPEHSLPGHSHDHRSVLKKSQRVILPSHRSNVAGSAEHLHTGKRIHTH